MKCDSCGIETPYLWMPTDASEALCVDCYRVEVQVYGVMRRRGRRGGRRG